MSIADIQTLGIGEGSAIVPPVSDYVEVSDDWSETEFRASVPGDTLVGFWTGEPGWVRIDVWPYTEVCIIRSGSVEIEDAAGAKRRFGPGESFIIPEGFQGVWHTLEPCEKIFVGVAS